MQGSIWDYWQAIVGLIAIVGVIIAYLAYRKQAKTKDAGVVQKMSGSEHGAQTARRDGVKQDMEDSKHGKQDA